MNVYVKRPYSSYNLLVWALTLYLRQLGRHCDAEDFQHLTLQVVFWLRPTIQCKRDSHKNSKRSNTHCCESQVPSVHVRQTCWTKRVQRNREHLLRHLRTCFVAILAALVHSSWKQTSLLRSVELKWFYASLYIHVPCLIFYSRCLRHCRHDSMLATHTPIHCTWRHFWFSTSGTQGPLVRNCKWSDKFLQLFYKDVIYTSILLRQCRLRVSSVRCGNAACV